MNLKIEPVLGYCFAKRITATARFIKLTSVLVHLTYAGIGSRDM